MKRTQMRRRNTRFSAYAPPSMQAPAVGDPRQQILESDYAAAKETLSRTANELRAITTRVREAHAVDLEVWRSAEPDGSPSVARVLALGRQQLSRLETAVRDLEQTWLFLERGGQIERDGKARAEIDDAAGGAAVAHIARQLLEAQEQERTRIAEELHDGPAQALANAAFQVEVIDRSLREDPLEAAAELGALRRLLDRELDRLRGFIHQLRPPLLEEAGLENALAEIADDLTQGTGIPVLLELGAPAALLDGSNRSAVLRVAQEALRNVRKHSGAKRVWLTTRLEPRQTHLGGSDWVLVVRDDGQGFETDDALALSSRRHFGLRFMRERAQLVGARLDIESTPSQGTSVRLAISSGQRS